MEDNSTPAELALSNDLILREIFSFLPTCDLIHRVSLTNKNWNEISGKYVAINREILIHKDNIISYSEWINNGGLVHKKLKLELYFYLDKSSLVKVEWQQIFSAFSNIVSYLQEFKLNLAGSINEESFVEVTSNLLQKLLLNSKDIPRFTLEIWPSKTVNYFPLLGLNEIDSLNNLKVITFQGNDNYQIEDLLLTLLKKSPNIERIKLNNSKQNWNFEEFENLQKGFPQFCEKLESLWQPELDQQLGDFLILNKCSSLKSLGFLSRMDIPSWERILDKYSNQIVHLHLNLGKRGSSQNLGAWNLTLPWMKNLESLTLDYCSISGRHPQWPILQWDSSEIDGEFSKLRNFWIYIDLSSNTKEDHQRRKIAYDILESTFQDRKHHPIFPGVTNIFGTIFNIDCKDFFCSDNPILIQRLNDYFPNVNLK